MIHAIPILDSASFGFDEYHEKAIGEFDRAGGSHFTIWRIDSPKGSGSEHKKLRSEQLVEWDAEDHETWLRETSGGTEVEYRSEKMMQARERLGVPESDVPCLAFFTLLPEIRPIGRLRILRTWFDSDASWRGFIREFCAWLRRPDVKLLCRTVPGDQDTPKRLALLLDELAASIERQQRRNSGGETLQVARPVSRLDVPEGCTWRDVTIAFVSEIAVSVVVRGFRRRVDFKRMGMVDRRTGNPSVQWQLLEALSLKSGRLTWHDPEADRKNKKRRERLSRDLCGLFGIAEGPFCQVEDGKGWQTRFSLLPKSRGAKSDMSRRSGRKLSPGSRFS